LDICEKICTFNARDLASAINTKEVVETHHAATGGLVHLRFPPEPNGYLHLGHVRSIWLNFHSARKLGGVCYLRYDDTNPCSERQDYID
jgi:glutaminyl-tRNA synthetase